MTVYVTGINSYNGTYLRVFRDLRNFSFFTFKYLANKNCKYFLLNEFKTFSKLVEGKENGKGNVCFKNILGILGSQQKFGNNLTMFFKIDDKH